MRKVMLLMAVLCGLMFYAQTASTTLNVRLSPVMGLKVSQTSVDIDIDTQEEYLEGGRATISNHLETFSTVGYKVSAKYLSSEFDPNTIAVKASGVNGVNYTKVNLTSTSETIISSPLGKGKKFHDVEYIVDKGLWDIEPGEYSTVIQYEIVSL